MRTNWQQRAVSINRRLKHRKALRALRFFKLMLVAGLCGWLLSCPRGQTKYVMAAQAKARTGVDPTVTWTQDKASLHPAETLIITIKVAVPTTETADATGVVLTVNLSSYLEMQSIARGAFSIDNSACITATQQPTPSCANATTNVPEFPLTLTPDSTNKITVAIGVLKRGETNTYLVRAKLRGT